MIDNKRTPYNNGIEDLPEFERCPFIPGMTVRFRRNPHKGAVTIRNYGLYSNKYSDVLEQIRINEFPAESTTEDIINEEEECSSCHGTMEMKETFTSSDLPLVMRLHIKKNHGPPEHGFSFQSAKSLLC